MKALKWTALGLGIAVVVFAILLWIAGFRSNAGHIDASVEIDKINLQVWPWITEPEKQKEWVGGLMEIKQQSPKKATWVMKDMEIEGEITESLPPQFIRMKLWSKDAFSGTAEYRLVELAEGRTKFEQTGDYHYDNWFARLLEPLITPQANKKALEDMRRLKEKIEANQ